MKSGQLITYEKHHWYSGGPGGRQSICSLAIPSLFHVAGRVMVTIWRPLECVQEAGQDFVC